MNTEQNDDIEIDLQDLFFCIIRKIWLVILAVVIGVVAAVLVTTLVITKKYESSSMICITNSSADLSSISLSDLQVGSALTNDYLVMVKSRPVLNKVISNLELDMTYENLRNIVSVNNPENTRILTITVSSTDSYMAKTIVDEITNISVKRIAELMHTSEPSIVEEGTVNTTPVSPNMSKNVLLGGLAGFVIALGIITVAYIMNDSIKTPEDVEKYLGLNALGVIPMEEGTSKSQMRKRDRTEDKAQRKHHKKKETR